MRHTNVPWRLLQYDLTLDNTFFKQIRYTKNFNVLHYPGLITLCKSLCNTLCIPSVARSRHHASTPIVCQYIRGVLKICSLHHPHCYVFSGVGYDINLESMSYYGNYKSRLRLKVCITRNHYFIACKGRI